jgi:hypothetical protein
MCGVSSIFKTKQLDDTSKYSSTTRSPIFKPKSLTEISEETISQLNSWREESPLFVLLEMEEERTYTGVSLQAYERIGVVHPS